MNKGDLKRRFFIAVFPPRGVTEEISKIEGRGSPDWEWKRPEDYHISLAFTGRLSEPELKKLVKALREFDFKAFDLSFEKLGVFAREPEDRKSPRHVLWAQPDADADTALRALHNRLAHFLSQRGFRYGLRQITPHLTVAKTEEAPNLVEAFARAAGGFKTPAWRCDRIELRETLPHSHGDHPQNNDGQGSRYRRIAEYVLS